MNFVFYERFYCNSFVGSYFLKVFQLSNISFIWFPIGFYP